MSEMIERVGRAIYEKSRERETSKALPLPSWADMTDEQRDSWHDEARAAIEAMRQPTKQMIDAGEQAMGAEGAHDCEVAAADIFRAMIAALLAEGK